MHDILVQENHGNVATTSGDITQLTGERALATQVV